MSGLQRLPPVSSVSGSWNRQNVGKPFGGISQIAQVVGRKRERIFAVLGIGFIVLDIRLGRRGRSFAVGRGFFSAASAERVKEGNKEDERCRAASVSRKVVRDRHRNFYSIVMWPGFSGK